MGQAKAQIAKDHIGKEEIMMHWGIRGKKRSCE